MPGENELAARCEQAGADEQRLTYRLHDTSDPEERLEDAAMFKALWDASDGAITATRSDDATFGAIGNRFHHKSTMPYWSDPAFLHHCGRSFKACLFPEIEEEVARLHSAGQDAFLKSGFDKFFIARVPVGETAASAMGEIAYSFIDSTVPMMVQECVDFTFEHRFFVIDRQVVTWSPAAYTLTPIDHPLPGGIAWRKQADKSPVPFHGFDAMLHLAAKVAVQMNCANAVIDIGIIADKPAVVEFNPLRIGQVGLFACNVRALAAASLRAQVQP